MSIGNELHPQEWGGRLSPADVHNVLFTRAGLGRRGYDEAEVDEFLERVQQELTRLIAEKADLRDEVARLRGAASAADAPATAVVSAEGSAAAPAADGALSKAEANLQAVRLLAAAQQTADLYVADAEKYSQRLTSDAREHSEALVDEARKAADEIVLEAGRLADEARSLLVPSDELVVGQPGVPSGPSPQELDEQIAYLRTFGQVVRVQLRSYLEALLRDVEAEWGRADPGVVAGAARVTTATQPDAAPSPAAFGTDRPGPAALETAALETAPPEHPEEDSSTASRAIDLTDRSQVTGVDEEYEAAHDQAPGPRVNGSPRRRKAATLHSR